ncbi:efflux RND transporter periplasmic adaptor subunit [Actinoalloteichus hymeniacidonis]|uniref:Uncharacterized protein n=1 Tax=Actinoalloteichus hymeniacidonis TaxID=340345 RepID=A0AAC9MZP9_9PSEU|nr:efflux RND transporter periplasmic adaptor subunit [Actinoalloteichus hymeniacidonis]AOS64307.1 hypothetical protein TL08_17535 [Actinoalloteichus hymeniacidonis]MBB5907625.1 hypothetical protein [Actinoalloteichus hymeniacidonis]
MVRKHSFLGALALGVAAVTVTTACSSTEPAAQNPELSERGTTMTTVTPSRQDLTSNVSLAAQVAMNPVFGVAAPVDGEVRFFDIADTPGTPTIATRVANIWNDNGATPVDIPPNSAFAGRLVEESGNVATGTPIVSARLGGYAIVAPIDGDQAYEISDALASVEAQIKNGPGPFPCTVLGTIAALPAGTIPEPEEESQPEGDGSEEGITDQVDGEELDGGAGAGDGLPQPLGLQASEATPLQVVCTVPDDVRLINGAAATLELVSEQVTDALVVPVEAVAGAQGRGRVDVLNADGERQTVDVELGLSDGEVIEVLSGLEGDETLAVPGPNIPPGEDLGPADGEGEGEDLTEGEEPQP